MNKIIAKTKDLILIISLIFVLFYSSAQTTFNIQNHKGGVINHKTVIIVKDKKVGSPLLDIATSEYEINFNKDSSTVIIFVENIGNDNAYIVSDKSLMIIEFPAMNSYSIPDFIPSVASNESLIIGIKKTKKFNSLVNYKKFLEQPIEKFNFRYFYYFKILYSGKNKKIVNSLHKIYEIRTLKANGKFYEADSVKYQDIKKYLIGKKLW